MPESSRLPGGSAAYHRTLDALFSGFNARNTLCRGRPDREVREPERLLAVARRLDLLPPPSRTVKVTGSKGKGTTARLIARSLQAAGHRVGLVVSPEERSHCDRMRINGVPIDPEDFVRFYAGIEPALAQAMEGAPGHFYFSPAGLFLLVALAWFAESGVDWVVLEGGRGARYDEVGHVPARIAVLTSLLLEHQERLGPALADIAADKLYIAEHAEELLAGAATQPLLSALPEWPRQQGKTTFVAPTAPSPGLPAWYGQDEALARAVCQRLVGEGAAAEPASASCGRVMRPEGEILYECAIHADSLDPDFLRGLDPARTCAVVGLTDDKDWRGVAAVVDVSGFARVCFVGLETSGGFLSSQDIAAAQADRFCGFLPAVDDGTAARRLFDRLLAEHGRLYVVGVQIFMRLLRNAYHVPLA